MNEPPTKPNKFYKDTNSYEWLRVENFVTFDVFEKLVNWLKSEFILYQQEECNGLIVYFPNGYFIVSREFVSKKNINNVNCRIFVQSKSYILGNNMNDKIGEVLNHLKKFYNIKNSLPPITNN